MLPREKRLNRAQFEKVSKGGRKLHSRFFSASLKEEKDLRFSFVVSKKVSGGAVKRNHLRRQVYELIRGLDLPYSLILFAKKGAGDLSFLEIKKEIEFLLRQQK
ncbi:MAG: ribonuclease P protein component [Candidatus Paceibacterota bacterium]